MRDLELLAPARNADIGIAAIDCGADAVYIAGPEFGARQNAGNSMEDVRRLCEYAHLFGARVFLTVNTIVYDTELLAAERVLKEAKEAGVDAVIAQDLAVFETLSQSQGTAIPVHASTQCAIRTPEQAKLYESLGASRLVLERQLSLEQIKAIREAVSCELEFFVHGALCVCYSGQCYMSEAIEKRSANRGACIQACRSLYDLVDGNGKVLVKDKALLSLKDYNLIGRLEDLASCGVCSFKIEGRLKSISYVRNVVKAYSSALDKLVETQPELYRRTSFGHSEGGFTPNLGKTFNRGYTELFIDGKKGKWSSMDAPKSIGEPIGTVERIFTGNQATMQVTVKLNKPTLQLSNGDGFSFVSKDHNEIVGFRGDVCRGAIINTRFVPELYLGALLYRNMDASFEKELSTSLPIRRIPVEVCIIIMRSAGAPSPAKVLQIFAKSQDGRIVEFEMAVGDRVADNTERMRALFESQIGKATGRYSFSLEKLDTEASDGRLPLMASSVINGIRREVATRLDAMPCGRIPMQEYSERQEISGLVPEELSYKYNVANGIAERAYRRLGAKKIDKAYESSHQKGAELMRSKYCIRHELGMCGNKEPLFLVNNGRRYRLDFDCSSCEMTVSQA